MDRKGKINAIREFVLFFLWFELSLTSFDFQMQDPTKKIKSNKPEGKREGGKLY